jgi:acyl dehydratase
MSQPRPISAQPTSERLYLSDLRVGQRFRTGTHTVTADEIQIFAYEFDPQPFYLNERAARDSVFGGLAASGWHTAALTMKLLVTGGPPIAGGMVGRGGELSGFGRRGQATRCASRAGSRPSHRPVPIPTEAG